MKTIILSETQLNEIKGFHGTAAKFDKFDHRHYLSTGCGSQAFGWGTYITDDVDVAMGYCKSANRNSTNNNLVKYDGKPILASKDNEAKQGILSLTNGDYTITHSVLHNIRNGIVNCNGDVESYISTIQTSLSKEAKQLELYVNSEEFKKGDYFYIEMYKDCKQRVLEYKTILRAFYSNVIDRNKLTLISDTTAYLYTVDIPDDNGSNYLYWYEEIPDDEFKHIASNLNKLPNKFKRNLRSDIYSFDPETFTDDVNFERHKEVGFPTFFGRVEQGGITVTGEKIYRGLVKLLGSGKAASLFLGYCGYVGIKYPTYTRWARPEDNSNKGSNYVIFNANNVKINKVEQTNEV